MSAKKKPPPTAAHLDKPVAPEMGIRLLEARIELLEIYGEDAMHPPDIRNGYTPKGIIRLIRGQIKFLKRDDPEALEIKASLEKDRISEEKRLARLEAKKEPCGECGHRFDHDKLGKYGCPNCHGEGLPVNFQSSITEIRNALRKLEQKETERLAKGEGAQWEDHAGVMRPPYMLRDEIARVADLLQKAEAKQNAKNLGAVGIAAEISIEHLTQSQKKGQGMDTPIKEKEVQGGDEANGAAKLFEQTSEIRKAISILRSEQRETRKRYKKAVTTLEQGLAAIYDNFEDKQMLLFDEEPALSPELQELVDHPSLM